ncbi:YbaN family protein [Crateriforma conspicua]|uniref:Inner membrane protein YbaN n=1 Tax=Crateriforma conspicua TaxID=2527996 RepID=A0A5C5Y5D0_9PLAN|nr:YbaN family protein [Crateriforma conspicua]QDV62548.1 Inner membrane protein YbaN [Crateriforma conspicua]TWT68642.1 Inner membrane protein YbaN [Crateriforma conspicua]
MAQEATIPTVSGWRRGLYWFAAVFFFVLAMIGVVLPGIPTTPFLLLMCYFLIRVSPAMHAKAMAWPVVGGPLRDWRDQGGVRSGVKVLAIAMVTLLVGSTLLFSPLNIAIKTVILLAAFYGIWFVWRLPTARSSRDAMRSEQNPGSSSW